MKKTLEFRKDFPIFHSDSPVVYLDSAATTQKPRQVLETLLNFYMHAYGTVHRGVYTLSKEATERYEEVRKKAKAFLNAQFAEEIVFTKGATQALNLLAQSFGKAFIHSGNVVLLTEIEHHSNLVPWQMICEEKGAELRFIPVDENGEIVFTKFLELLDSKVKLVSISHVSNVLGTIHPVKEIIARAHEVGALVCLDGAQAAAHLPLDVQDLDVDFYTFSSHKLYGPTGVGILYGKKELLEKMPPIEGGGNMVERVTLLASQYQKLPLKFEAGTPAIAETMGLGSALDYLTKIGMETVKDHEKALLEYAQERLLEIPHLTIIGRAKEKGGIISFVCDGVHPFDLATFLDCRNIAVRSGHHCSQPTMDRFGINATCRISFGLYNTFEEIDYLIDALKEIIDLLK